MIAKNEGKLSMEMSSRLYGSRANVCLSRSTTYRFSSFWIPGWCAFHSIQFARRACNVVDRSLCFWMNPVRSERRVSSAQERSIGRFFCCLQSHCADPWPGQQPIRSRNAVIVICIPSFYQCHVARLRRLHTLLIRMLSMLFRTWFKEIATPAKFDDRLRFY